MRARSPSLGGGTWEDGSGLGPLGAAGAAGWRDLLELL